MSKSVQDQTAFITGPTRDDSTYVMVDQASRNIPGSKPNLLNLPREIRNIIYSYVQDPALVHAISRLEVPFVHWPDQGSYTQELKTTIEALNLPYLNLLLTHPQLYAEYKQADCFKNLTIQVTVNTANLQTVSRESSLQVCPTRSVDYKKFSHLASSKHISLFYNAHDVEQSMQQGILTIMPSFVSAEAVETVRLFQRRREAYTIRPDRSPIVPWYRLDFKTGRRPDPSFLFKVDCSMFGLPMVQRGEGLRYGKNQLDEPSITLNGRELSVHEWHRIGVYVCAREGSKTPTFWSTHEEILNVDESFRPQEPVYGPWPLKPMTSKIRKLCKGLRGRLVEWKEARGAEECAKWN